MSSEHSTSLSTSDNDSPLQHRHHTQNKLLTEPKSCPDQLNSSANDSQAELLASPSPYQNERFSQQNSSSTQNRVGASRIRARNEFSLLPGEIQDEHFTSPCQRQDELFTSPCLSQDELLTWPSQTQDEISASPSQTQEELYGLMNEKAQQIFELCDGEKKGFITKPDMQRLQQDLPLSPDQLDVVFDKLDVDDSGRLTLDKFTRGFGA